MLIPNLQSEFTQHITLFCKIEFKNAFNKPNKHTFLFICSIKFFLTKLGFFFIAVRHKFSSFGFSCNLTTFSIAFQAPTVICHHQYIRLPLVPSFQNFNVKEKAFSMFFTHITKVLGKIVQAGRQKKELSSSCDTQALQNKLTCFL